MKFKEYKLSDVVQIIGGGTPKRSVAEYWNGEIPWISIKDFSSTKRINFTQEAITSLGLQKSSSKILDKDDIVISARGTVGLVAQLGKPMAFNQSCYGLKAREMAINDFLYYWLKQNVTYVKANTHGSVFDTITKDTFNNLLIKLPSLKKQKKIVSILDSIDSKIEINNQIISNLEELASTLFKRWFVDFEFPDENGNPYKSSGGKMVDSELGEIPEGWHIDIISNLMENFDRKRVPLSKMQREKRKGEYPYYGAASLMDYVDDFLFDGIHLLLGEDGTVITKEGNPVLQYVWGKFWVNNHAHVLKGRGYVSTEWLYLWFKQTNVSGIVTGAVQPKISQTNLNRLKVVFPDKELLIKFQKNIGIMFDKLVVLSNEMTTLTELRDTLLPRLLSGEIELSEDGEV